MAQVSIATDLVGETVTLREPELGGHGMQVVTGVVRAMHLDSTYHHGPVMWIEIAKAPWSLLGATYEAGDVICVSLIGARGPLIVRVHRRDG